MNEKGFSLVIALFAIVFITILGLSILTLNLNSLNTSKKEQVDQSVFYIAESGLTYRLLEIESEVNEAYNQFIGEFNDASNEDKKYLIDNFPTNFYDDYLENLHAIPIELKKYRESKNLNYKQAADLIGVSAHAWAWWEDGSHTIKRENYYKFKKLIETDSYKEIE